MQKFFLGMIAMAAVLVGGYFAYQDLPPMDAGAPQVACTTEAKECPDGSYVGREGPHCEFAACPTQTQVENADVTSITEDAQLGKPIVAFGVTITPLSIVQDSRCPSDVQCIQAGTVQVKVKINGSLGEYTATLELNKPLVSEEATITLTGVAPTKDSKQQIKASDYVFTLQIDKP